MHPSNFEHMKTHKTAQRLKRGAKLGKGSSCIPRKIHTPGIPSKTNGSRHDAVHTRRKECRAKGAAGKDARATGTRGQAQRGLEDRRNGMHTRQRARNEHNVRNGHTHSHQDGPLKEARSWTRFAVQNTAADRRPQFGRESTPKKVIPNCWASPFPVVFCGRFPAAEKGPRNGTPNGTLFGIPRDEGYEPKRPHNPSRAT